MNASFRLSSPSTKTPPKSAATLWTARLVATLWKLAVKRARSLRRQARNGAAADYVELMLAPLSPTTSEDSALDLDDDASIMREAALSVVASGVVSLADFEAVTGFRLPKTRDHGATAMKDDDASSVAATDTSDDSCSIADSDASESLVDLEESTPASTPKAKLVPTLSRREATSSTKPTKWVCVGYGRYVKVQDVLQDRPRLNSSTRRLDLLKSSSPLCILHNDNGSHCYLPSKREHAGTAPEAAGPRFAKWRPNCTRRHLTDELHRSGQPHLGLKLEAHRQWNASLPLGFLWGVERVEINVTRTDEHKELVFVLEVFLSLPTSRLPVSKPSSNEERAVVAADRPTFRVERGFRDFEELRKRVSTCVSTERPCSCQYCLKFVEYIRFSSSQPRGLVKRFAGEEKRRRVLQRFINDFVAMGQRRVQKLGKRKCQAQQLVPKVLTTFLLNDAIL